MCIRDFSHFDFTMFEETFRHCVRYLTKKKIRSQNRYDQWVIFYVYAMCANLESN